MTSKFSIELLQKAIRGDTDSINMILCLYEPLIRYHSMIGGSFDEDCCQYIMLHLVRRITKFRI